MTRRRGFVGQRGADNPMSKLTADQVAAIRASTGRQVDIAARFGCAQATVSRIQRNRSWSVVGHRPDPARQICIDCGAGPDEQKADCREPGSGRFQTKDPT